MSFQIGFDINRGLNMQIVLVVHFDKVDLSR
jgi:hypothetical protein